MNAPNNAINSDVQKRRFAPLLHAGYGERSVIKMIYFYSFLMISVFAITLNCVSGTLNEVYTRETTNIILIVIAAVLSLFAAAFVFSAKNKKILSWRLGWLAAAVLCLASGWLTLPNVEKRHLLGKAVETGIQIDGVRREYPNPSTKDERVWVLENELKAKLADIRWEYWNKIRRIAPEKENAYGWSLIYFTIGILCLLSSIFAGFVIRKIE